MDQKIETLPSYIKDGEKSKYETMTFAEYGAWVSRYQYANNDKKDEEAKA